MLDNLVDLRYFLEVAKTGNITRAAERLGVTQPSLSVALKKLEQKSGVTLLERSKQGVFLTRQGSLLAKTAERMLADWEREIRMVTQGSLRPMGQYTMGSHVSVAQYTMPGFMPLILDKFPEVEFRLIHDLSRKITESVVSRECDIGLVINPVPHPDLVMHKLLTDEVTLFKHPHYHGDVLILDPALKQSQTLLKNVRKAFDYKREIHTSSLDLIRTLCETKAGVGILPTRVAEVSKKIIPVENAPHFKDELFLIYRVERRKEPSFLALISEVRGSI